MAKKKKTTQNQIASLDWKMGQMKQRILSWGEKKRILKARKKKIQAEAHREKRLGKQEKKIQQAYWQGKSSWCLIEFQRELERKIASEATYQEKMT